MGILERYRQLTQQPQVNQPVDQPQQQETPQVDTSDAINSIASLIGPSPEEREAQQQKLLKQKRTMLAWTGLFDGLRQLANLYSVSRGANNMQFTDNPYQTIEKGYQAELTRQDANQRYANAYAKQQMDYKRQAEDDQLKRETHKAQQEWTKSRIEMAKEESKRKDAINQANIEKAKAIAENNMQKAHYWELVSMGVPDKQAAELAKVYAQAEKNRQQGNAAQTRANIAAAGTETTVMKPDGSVTTTITKPAGSSGNSSKGGKYSRFRKNSSKGGSGSSGKFDKYKVNKK